MDEKEETMINPSEISNWEVIDYVAAQILKYFFRLLLIMMIIGLALYYESGGKLI